MKDIALTLMEKTLPEEKLDLFVMISNLGQFFVPKLVYKPVIFRKKYSIHHSRHFTQPPMIVLDNRRFSFNPHRRYFRSLTYFLTATAA